MPQKFIVAQTKVAGERTTTQIRGSFSQKKKLWDIVFTPLGWTSGHSLYDDVSKKVKDMTYGNLCNLLTNNGRAVVIGQASERVALIVSASENDIRPWDTDESGEAIPNPVAASSEQE